MSANKKYVDMEVPVDGGGAYIMGSSSTSPNAAPATDSIVSACFAICAKDGPNLLANLAASAAILFLPFSKD